MFLNESGKKERIQNSVNDFQPVDRITFTYLKRKWNTNFD